MTSPNPKEKKNERNFADLFGDSKSGNTGNSKPAQNTQPPPPPEKPKQEVKQETNQQANQPKQEEKKNRTTTFNNLFGLK